MFQPFHPLSISISSTSFEPQGYRHWRKAKYPAIVFLGNDVNKIITQFKILLGTKHMSYYLSYLHIPSFHQLLSIATTHQLPMFTLFREVAWPHSLSKSNPQGPRPVDPASASAFSFKIMASPWNSMSQGWTTRNSVGKNLNSWASSNYNPHLTQTSWFWRFYLSST